MIYRSMFRKKTPIIVGVCVLVVGLLCTAGILWRTHSGTSTDSAARRIVSACNTIGTDHSACYEAEVPTLYPGMPVARIFDVVREIRTLDSSYQFCHVLGHKIGERVVAEDPNSWVGAIPLNPSDGLCSNGFIHGVVGGRFRSEVLNDTTIEKFVPDFIRACQAHDAWTPSDLDRAICYHGMGHLFDFITDANIPKALDLCSRVAPEAYSRVCIQGVFMQIYQPLEPDDYQLIARMKVKPMKATVRTFCATFKDPIYVGSCLEESWPFFQKEITDGSGVASFCSGQPNTRETDQCYVSMSAIIGRMSLDDSSKAAAACDRFPTTHRETCYSYTAQAVLEEDLSDSRKAIDLCERAGDPAAGQCISDLVGHAHFTFGNNTKKYDAFCAALPSTSRCIDER